MRLTIYTFSFLISTFFLSCKQDKTDEIVAPIHSASLQISVFRNDLTGTPKPLSGVTVYLFLNDYDRTQNQNVKYTGTVNDSGKISFNKLSNDYYFILSSHPTYGTQKSETATPNNSTSYEEIDY